MSKESPRSLFRVIEYALHAWERLRSDERQRNGDRTKASMPRRRFEAVLEAGVGNSN